MFISCDFTVKSSTDPRRNISHGLSSKVIMQKIQMYAPNMQVKDHPALKPIKSRGLLWEICIKSQNNAEHENTKNPTGE